MWLGLKTDLKRLAVANGKTEKVQFVKQVGERRVGLILNINRFRLTLNGCPVHGSSGVTVHTFLLLELPRHMQIYLLPKKYD